MKTLKLKPKVKLKKGAKVLDIGSGNNSLDIATHCVDLMPHSNAERPGDLELPSHIEFKVGAIEAIPYPDQYFDFVHAAHILEHSTDPAKAIGELTRVAPAGYIETPFATSEQGSILSDSQVGWDFHRWYVWTFPNRGCLYLKPKTPQNLFQYCQCRFGKRFGELVKIVVFQDLDPLLPYFCKMMQFNWKSRVPFEIWDEFRQGGSDDEVECTCMYSAFFHQVKVYFRSLLQIRRRMALKRKFPEAFQILKTTAKSI